MVWTIRAKDSDTRRSGYKPPALLRIDLHCSITHSLIHHFETVPNTKKLQTTTEMWLLDYISIEKKKKNIVEKGEIAQNGQFHLFRQCFPKAFFFSVLKWVYTEEKVNMPSGKYRYTRGYLWVSNQTGGKHEVSQKCPGQAGYRASDLRIDSPAFY